ncbi:MAG TPA: PAS domain S-box protein [Acidimicrobiales bacterium]|nr:PAS domain S-box protein [Acidimicrobiales bacterium]
MATVGRQSETDMQGSFLEAFLELTPDAAVVVDAGGTIRAANDLVGSMFGCSSESLVGQPVEVLLPTRFRRVHEGHRQGYVASPTARPMGANLDLYGLRADGSEFPVDISLAPLANYDGPLVVAAIRDITERKRAQDVEARLAAIITSSDDAVVSFDHAKDIQSWNPGAHRLLGHDEPDIIGRPLSVLLTDEEEAALDAHLREVASGGRVEPYDAQAVHRDGHMLDVAITISPLRDRRGEVIGFSMLMRDISARLRAAAELAEARRVHEELLLVSDRERIARDLHDLVIQRVFAAGIGLQSVARLAEPPEVAMRILAVVDELDDTIREIRSTIFSLESERRVVAGLRSRVMALASRSAGGLGFEPAVRFTGPVDSLVPDEVAEHVVAVVREALSNVARHAQASSVTVEVIVGPDELRLQVTDDGKGLGQPDRVSGLRNLRERAESLGGSLELPPVDAGTVVVWRVPLG